MHTRGSPAASRAIIPFHVRSSTCRNERCTHLHARLACCMARNILTRMLALPPRSDEKHPPDSICVCLPCGSHSSTRPGSAGLYGNGTGASHQSGPQCTGLCPPGSFCSGATSVPKLCPLGSFCPAGTTVPQPCPGGTWLGTMGAASASSCTPVQAGYWAPLGSSAPQRCPASGFRCPGAAADTINTPGGSLPIELESGSSATLTKVEVVQQQMTLDISINDYNETAVKLGALNDCPLTLLCPPSKFPHLNRSATISSFSSIGRYILGRACRNLWSPCGSHRALGGRWVATAFDHHSHGAIPESLGCQRRKLDANPVSERNHGRSRRSR